MAMPDFNVGPILAADLNTVADAVDNLRAPTQTSWTASIAWTSSGTPPAIGTSTLAAEYGRPTDAAMFDAYMGVTFAGATFGTGYYLWATPLTLHANWVGMPIGIARAIDTSAGFHCTGVVWAESTTTMIVAAAPVAASANDRWGSGTPFTWANADILRITIRARAA